MSFNAWPDNEAQADKLVGHDAMLSSRPSVLEPLVPTPASEICAGSLSRALSAAISSHELLIGQSSSVGSDELMRATLERRDAMSMVRAELDRMPRDALLAEPTIRGVLHCLVGFRRHSILLWGAKCPLLVPALLNMLLLPPSLFFLNPLAPNNSPL